MPYPTDPTPRGPRISRRHLIALAGAGVAAHIAPAPWVATSTANSRNAVRAAAKGPFATVPPRLPDSLFTLGVASGDPVATGGVLWTRLAPEPLAGGGMPDADVTVEWQVADDPAFGRIARSGTALASPAWAHSVHVEVRGLRPDREYWYRFRARSRRGPETWEISPVGRLRTAPADDAWPGRLRWVVASCQNWQHGWYTAWRDVAVQDLAFVAFLGDYIYETAPATTRVVRTHEGTGEPVTVVEYRNRYAQYRSDPALQAAHATHPFVVTLDDHELDNNWADDVPQDPGQQSPAEFRARRTAALRAYWEHMPLPMSARPQGPDARFYRRLSFGRLATLSILDTRQYRSRRPTTEDGAEDPARTMTGERQERWLADGLTRTSTPWNLIGNQAMMAQVDHSPGAGRISEFDSWDGYRAQRRRLLETIAAADVPGVVVLTGDQHATWVGDLRPDFDDPGSPVVGAELTGTSISSGGDPDLDAFHRRYGPVMAAGPHWKFIDNRRGYLLCDLGRDHLLTDLRTVTTVTAPGGRVRTTARFLVEADRPGVAIA